MISTDFNEELKKRTQEIEILIREFLPRPIELNAPITEALDYSILAGGKRLRPMLMRETFRLFKGREEDTLKPFMAAIEMIHTYSLVHDDLPAMDNDTYRRGKKTTWSMYGEDMGVLAGDALLNYAYETALGAFEYTNHTDRVIRALGILAKKSGIYGMIGGQCVDVKNTGMPIDEETLSYIYRLKTGALLEAAMTVGAVLSGAGESEIEAISRSARAIGMAFQIQDDILDLTSTSEELGKPVMSDEKNNKTTYVTLFGMDKAKEDVLRYSEEGISLIGGLKKKNTFLMDLIESLIYRRK